jgi:tetraacyldisaccharide 4'-kinase
LYSLSLERVSWEQIKDLRCVAFAGIARPEGFFTALREKGLTLTAEIAFSDHQDYDERTLLTIRAACEQADVCLTTEKDAVKLKPADLPIPCYAVPLDIRISPEQDLEACLNGFLQ